MKSVGLSLVVSIALVVVPAAMSPGQEQQAAEVLLGTALHQEEVEGQLEQAIETYATLLARFPEQRSLAAKALLRMGLCYEKLGNAEARRAYERVLRDYADQAEPAGVARARLAALRMPASADRAPAFATRQVWAPLGDMGSVEGSPSPDGRYLSFVDYETGDLAVRDLNAGTNRRLTNKGTWKASDEFALFSRWSPDGTRIAYDWYDGHCCVDLRVVPATGGRPQVLLDFESDEWLQVYDWTPNGSHVLVFVERKDRTREILLVSAADGSVRVIKTFDRTGRFPNVMRFSPDGRYVAYDQPQVENGAESDIFSIAVDGGREAALVGHPAHDLLLGWTPDGEGILFASDRTGSFDMWYVSVSRGTAGDSPERVKSGLEQIAPLGFTRDGSFYYVLGTFMRDVYVAQMDPLSGKVLAPLEKAIKRMEGTNSWPEYSPDGRYLAFVSTRSHQLGSVGRANLLCVRSLESGEDRVFPTRFRMLAGPRWSPSGKTIYLAAWDESGMGIYAVDAQTGTMVPVVRSDAAQQRLFGHDVSRDGNSLFYEQADEPPPPPARRSDVRFRILRRDLTTGDEQQVYVGEPADRRLRFSLSPDGRWLAVVNASERKALRVLPAAGGEPRTLLEFEEPRFLVAGIAWTADGKHILLPRWLPAKDDLRVSLWRVPVDGGAPQELGLVMTDFTNLSVHPDGERLAVSSMGFVRKLPTVWVMENIPTHASAKR